jgi:branched-chain amino acid transport system permease protein
MPAMAGLLLTLLVVWLVVNLVKEPSYFVTISFIGLTNGAVYALVALGYTLVYGILELINFAHGDVFMLGGLISATMLITVFGLTENSSTGAVVVALLGSLAVAMVACGVINATIEFVAYRPLRGAPRLAPLITAIGMSFILQNVAIFFYDTGYTGLPRVLPHGSVFSVGGVT